MIEFGFSPFFMNLFIVSILLHIIKLLAKKKGESMHQLPTGMNTKNNTKKEHPPNSVIGWINKWIPKEKHRQCFDFSSIDLMRMTEWGLGSS